MAFTAAGVAVSTAAGDLVGAGVGDSAGAGVGAAGGIHGGGDLAGDSGAVRLIRGGAMRRIRIPMPTTT